MNKVRRATISEMVDKISVLSSEIEELQSAVETVLDEETDYRDNIPENLQASERYEMAEAACDNLESAKDALDEMSSSIDEITDSLNSAME